MQSQHPQMGQSVERVDKLPQEACKYADASEPFVLMSKRKPDRMPAKLGGGRILRAKTNPWGNRLKVKPWGILP